MDSLAEKIKYVGITLSPLKRISTSKLTYFGGNNVGYFFRIPRHLNISNTPIFELFLHFPHYSNRFLCMWEVLYLLYK